MAISKDRVAFFLAPRYYQGSDSCNGMRRNVCIKVLVKAFGHDEGFWASTMALYPNGFSILCRPSQFARFIVYRHEDGNCINGIRDLNPTIEKKMTVHEKIALAAKCDLDVVKRVMYAAGYSVEPPLVRGSDQTDVSKNFNN